MSCRCCLAAPTSKTEVRDCAGAARCADAALTSLIIKPGRFRGLLELWNHLGELLSRGKLLITQLRYGQALSKIASVQSDGHNPVLVLLTGRAVLGLASPLYPRSSAGNHLQPHCLKSQDEAYQTLRKTVKEGKWLTKTGSR